MTDDISGSIPAARLRLAADPDVLWAFETVLLPVELQNLSVAEFAQPACPIVGTVALHSADGSFIRQLASHRITQPLGIGEQRRLELGLEMKSLAGEYQLRFGLQHAGNGAGPRPIALDAPPVPIVVKNTIFDAFVELVNACNFRCTFCPQTTLKRTQRPMDFELATKIVRDLADMGHHYPIRVHLLGEPLLYKRFFEFVEATHDMGQRILLATNGSRFSEDNVSGIMRTGLDQMVVSLNTPDEALYNEQRGTKVPYSEYIAGIERMVTAVASEGAPPAMRINVLYDRDRADDPEQLAFVRSVANHWIDVVRRVSGEDLPHAEEAVDLDPSGTALLGLCDGIELQWTAYHNWGEKGRRREQFCSFPWRQLAILVDGQATACCVDAEGEIVLGDARQQSIEEIWNGPALNRMREGFLDSRATNPRCARCNVHHDIEQFFPHLVPQGDTVDPPVPHPCQGGA